jgi:predicted RNA-binding protein with PUA-like domain
MNHWLLKSEPGTYSWDQLVKDRSTPWSGVRNHQAANNLKAMKKGDLAFFYHSGARPSIVGICVIAREAYPDPTDKTGRFVMVDVKAKEAMKRPIELGEIKSEPRLADLALLRQGRLSVSPVGSTHWRLLCAMGGAKLCA